MPTDLNSLMASSRSAPGIDPNTHMAIANQATDPGDASVTAQATQAIGSTFTDLNTLKALSAKDQNAVWNQASNSQRSLYQAGGYDGPPQVKKKGFWGSLDSAVQTGLGGVVHGVRDVLGAPSALMHDAQSIPGVGDAVKVVQKNFVSQPAQTALSAVATVGAAGQHWERAYRGIERGITNVDASGNVTQTQGTLTAEQASHAFDPLAGWSKKFFSPSEWAKAWQSTKDGERTFDSSAYNRIAQENQDKTIAVGSQNLPITEVAAAIASGTMDSYAVNKLGNDNDAKGQLNKAVYSNPELQGIVEDLNNHKLSFGRMLVPDSMWKSNAGLASALSGVGDAIFDVKSDPTLRLGKAVKTVNAARFGIKTQEEVDNLLRTGSARGIADAATSSANPITATRNVMGATKQAVLNNVGLKPQTLDQIVAPTTSTGIRGAVGSYFNDGNRWVKEMSGLLSKTDPEGKIDYNAIVDRFPGLSSALPAMANEGIHTSEDLVKAMKLPTGEAATEDAVRAFATGHTVASRIIIGDGSVKGQNMLVAPHLSAIDSKMLNVKGFGQKTIDWSKNVELPRVGDLTDSKSVAALSALPNAAIQTAEKGLNILGSSAFKIGHLLPEGRTFDPNGADGVEFMDRFMDTYLDKETKAPLMNAWISAGYDTKAKRNIYLEALTKVFESAGLDETDEGKRIMNKYVSKSEGAFLRQSYSSGGIDKVTRDGDTFGQGILENQLTTQWSMPSYRDMVAMTQRNILAKRVYGVNSNSLGSMFNAIWKPAQLLRFGFPVRVALEELMGASLRNSPVDSIKAGLALPIARTLEDAKQGLDPEHAALAAEDGDTAISNFAAHLAQRTKVGIAKAGKAIVGEDLYNPIKWGLDGNGLEKGIAEEISARHGGVDLAADAGTKTRLLQDGVKTVPIYFRNGSDYREYMKGHDLFTPMWKSRLDEISNSKFAREYLENFDMPEDQIVRHLADKLQSPEWSKEWNMAGRAKEFGDNKVVGVNATQDEAALAWAKTIVDHVDAHVREPHPAGLPYNLVPQGKNMGLRASNRAQGVDYDVTAPGEGSHVPRTGLANNAAKTLKLHSDDDQWDLLKPKRQQVGGVTMTFQNAPAVTPGTVALKHLTDDKKFQTLLALPKDKLIKELQKKFPQHDYALMDRNALLGAYGSQLARRNGYRSLLLTGSTGKSQFTSLADDVVHEASPKAPAIQDLIEQMHQGKSPDLDTLHNVPEDMRPAAVTGPDQIPIAVGGVANGIKNFTENQFDHIGKMIDWASRQPLYLYNFARAHNELRPIIEEAFGKGPASEQALKELVTARAIRNSAPFIHDPEIRSQMNILTQNLLPFQFAQEQFYKRWARTFKHSPEAIRKAQLATNAVNATGIVQDDGTGNPIFHYPITGFAQHAVASVMSALGMPTTVPVHGGFSGQLAGITAGADTLTQGAKLSYGPLVSFPLSFAARLFPELQPIKGQLLGPQGANKATWEQIVPSTGARLFHAINDGVDDKQYAAAMIHTIQDIAASKYNDKDPNALDKWFRDLQSNHDGGKARQELLDRVKNGSRITAAIRTLLGFAAPSAPQAEIGNTVFAKRMAELQKQGMDFSTAKQELLKQDPSLTPYAIFMSEGTGQEPLPSTAESLKMLDSHEQFFRDHPDAAGYLLPNGPTDTKYNSEAYRLQMAYKMRERKAPDKWLDDLLFEEASGTYFATRDAYLKHVADLHGPLKTAADTQWAQFKNQYMADNPRFSHLLAQKQANASNRSDEVKAVVDAVSDPRVPKNDQTTQIGTLAATYQAYLAQQAALSGRNGPVVDRQRKANTATMTHFAQKYVADHPLTQNLYNSLIRVDLEGTN